MADSTEALLAGLHLLRQLHEHGVLDVAQKTVRGGEGLTASLLHILGGQSSTALLRNVTELGKTLSELDPGEVSVLGHAVTVGVHEGARHVAAGRASAWVNCWACSRTGTCRWRSARSSRS